MPMPLFYARTVLARALPSDVTAVSYLVTCLSPGQSFISLPWEVHVFCQALWAIAAISHSFTSDDRFSQGFLTQTWSSRKVTSYTSMSPRKTLSLVSLFRLSPQPSPSPFQSPVKSCLLPDTTLTDPSYIHCSPDKSNIYRFFHIQHAEYWLVCYYLHSTYLTSRIVL